MCPVVSLIPAYSVLGNLQNRTAVVVPHHTGLRRTVWLETAAWPDRKESSHALILITKLCTGAAVSSRPTFYAFEMAKSVLNRTAAASPVFLVLVNRRTNHQASIPLITSQIWVSDALVRGVSIIGAWCLYTA